jgi:hypothetical protein
MVAWSLSCSAIHLQQTSTHRSFNGLGADLSDILKPFLYPESNLHLPSPKTFGWCDNAPCTLSGTCWWVWASGCACYTCSDGPHAGHVPPRRDRGDVKPQYNSAAHSSFMVCSATHWLELDPPSPGAPGSTVSVAARTLATQLDEADPAISILK